MTPIRNLLSDAVRYGLAAGAVGIAGLASMSAFAQDATAPAATDTTKAKNLDRVEVIGSRIKRAVDTEPTQPVTTLTRADIQQTGLTTTFDIINHISASDGSGLSTVTTQTNGSDGSQFVSLRNLGSQRTLVLVDGKRWVTDGFGNVDLSVIPVAIIERIEVLKDGASAIYGSDAIAGVINIITRKKFEGAEIGWYYGETSHNDGQQNSEDVTIGANGDRTNAVIALSRSQQLPIFSGNRKISDASTYGCDALLSNYPASDPNGEAGLCGSTFGQFGRFFGAGLAPQGEALNNSFDSGNASGNPANAVATAPGTKPSDFHPWTDLDRYNFAPVNYLQQPATRNNLFASGHFDITDNVQAYARVSYTERQSTQQLAQVPTSLSSSGGFGPQWAFGVSPKNIFNPFGTQISGTFFRNVAVGPRTNIYDSNTLASTAGLQGSFSLSDRNFDWEVYAQYNDNHETKIGENYINLFNLKNALGPSFADAAGIHCGVYTAGAPNNGAIAGCVPFNVFGGPDEGLGNSYTRSDNPALKYTITSADVQNMINYISYTETQQQEDKGINFGGNLSGEIAPLQGGMLSFATGIEERREQFELTPDALVASGGSSDNFEQPTNGATKVDEAYVELDAPLLKDVVGAKELEFDAAARKSRYTADGTIGIDNFDVNPGSPITKKFSMRWKPINDLLLRASYGDTFRAPQVRDLFGGGEENFPAATDPCSNSLGTNGKTNFSNLPAAGQALCESQGVPAGGVTQLNSQIRALAGGNPLLQPEHGKNTTFGFVYSPSYANGLNFTVDYWKIDLKDAIITESVQTFLEDCYAENDFGNSCNFITRIPSTGQISLVENGELNVNRQIEDGIDFGMNYKREFGDWGTFGVKWDTTYTEHNEIQGVEFVGEYNGAPNWKYRSIATFDWTKGDWDAAWTLRYMSKQDESCDRYGLLLCNHPTSISSIADVAATGVGFNRMGAVTYDDVQLGWKAPWKAHLAIGARNVFGKEPPLSAQAFAQSFDASYDLPGGPFYYFQYRQDF